MKSIKIKGFGVKFKGKFWDGNNYTEINNAIILKKCKSPEDFGDNELLKKGKLVELERVTTTTVVDSTLYNKLKDVFLAHYLDVAKEEYYFMAKDGAALKRLKVKIAKSYKNIDTEPTDDNIIFAFRVILKKMPEFFQNNLDLTLIDSKYNSIIQQIKGGKKTKTEQLEEYARETARKMAEE